MHAYALLAASLPFHLDDTEAAAQAFDDGRAGNDQARQHADIWAYAWMMRYTIRKFLSERSSQSSDLDVVQERAYEGIRRAMDRVTEPGKFPNYVMRVCRNAILTHRERHRLTTEADDTTLAPVVDDYVHDEDAVVCRRDLANAIEGLPPAVREVARLRWIDHLPLGEIVEATGHPAPTIRAYFSKAVARFRDNPILREHYYDDVLPLGAHGTGGSP